MLRDRNIAFFIDVDNVGLSSEQYADVMDQLRAMGNILTGKVYGAGDRKHKEIYDDADLRGYRMERPMRIKRRGRKDFDARIFVDVVEAVNRAPAIDAVCIVAQATDLVYLYSYLHSRGIKIIALDNVDEASCAFIDEVVDLGIVPELKLPKSEPVKQVVEQPTPVEEPAPVVEEEAAPASGLDRTDELLKEIERLRQLASTPTEQPEPQPVAEEPAPVVEEEPVVEAQQEQPAQVEEAPAVEEVGEEPKAEEPAEEPAPETGKATPRAAYAPSNDSDLIRRIEDLRRSSQGDDDELIDEIRKLLDGLE